jgi:LCP family protein required for cell wall assembly
LLVVLDEGLHPRTDRRLLLRAAICAVLVVLMTAGTTVAAVLLQVQDVVTIVQHGQPPIPRVHSVLDDVSPGKPQTLLLLGSDHRYAYDVLGAKKQANSDTMILVHLDADAAATTVLSIPRDLKVNIPGVGVGKINSAFAAGGPVLAAGTVRELLGIPINHVFVTTFVAFSRAVDFIGCVYGDVDHRYYVPPNAGYAQIDLQAGYQRLCGGDALSFVRFRHADTDLVRGARQQAFLRAAAQQVKVSGLIGRVKGLVRVLARYTQTDVRSGTQILRLLKLAIESSNHPVSQISFPAILPTDPKDTFVYYDQTQLAAAVHRFLHPAATRSRVPGTPAPQKSGRHHGGNGGQVVLAPLVPSPTQAAVAHQLRKRLHFRPFYLSGLVPGSYATSESPRSYSIRDPAGVLHRAYRWVFYTGVPGEYYGLQGTTWADPPILHEATGATRVHGRKAILATSGGRIVWIAWHARGSLHWVTNTLSRTLSNRQMLALADAARR